MRCGEEISVNCREFAIVQPALQALYEPSETNAAFSLKKAVKNRARGAKSP